jgi:hypothetical protein
LYSQDADLFIDPAAASSDIFFSFLIFLSIIFPLSTNILVFCLLRVKIDVFLPKIVYLWTRFL